MNLAASAWIMVLPCTRGGLTPAAKILLLALWGHTTWDLHESQRAHPSRATLSAETGLTIAAVKDALAVLADIGWIIRDPNGWALMWMSPAVQAAGSAVQAAGHVADSGGSSSRQPGGSSSRVGGSSSRVGGSSSRPSERSLSSFPSESEQKGDAHAQAATDEEHPSIEAPPVDPGPEPGTAAKLDARQHEPPAMTAAERKSAAAAENAAKIQAAWESKQSAAAEFEARVRPHGTAQREAKQGGVAAAIDDLPPGIWAVVESHPATISMALNPREAWVRALGEVVIGRRITVDQFRALLDRLESQRTALGTAGYNAAVRAGTFPAIEDLWFKWGSKSAVCRAWLDESIEIVQLPPGQSPSTVAPSTSGMSPSAIVGSTEKWRARIAENDAASANRPPVPLDDDDIDWGPHSTGIIQ